MPRRRYYTPFLGMERKPSAEHSRRKARAPRAELEKQLRDGHVFDSPRYSQPDHLLLINEAVWKDRTITAVAIRELGDPPECPPVSEDSIPCVTLLSETGDPVETLLRNWTACRFIHGVMHTEKLNGLHFTPACVMPRKGATVRPRGLRWAICELGRRFKDQRALYVGPKLDRQGLVGMGQELPLIAAMHPHWAIAMDGDILPFVTAPDLLVNPRGQGGFTNILRIAFSKADGQVTLGPISIAGHFPEFGHGFLR